MSEELVRIKVISLELNRVREETLWAKSVGSGLFEVRALPKFSEGISNMDVVQAEQNGPDGIPRVTGIVYRGGHNTIRILFRTKTNEVKRKVVIDYVRDLGAEMEEGDAGLWSIDIAKNQDYQGISNYLTSLRKRGYLECEANVGMSTLLLMWRQQRGLHG